MTRRGERIAASILAAVQSETGVVKSAEVGMVAVVAGEFIAREQRRHGKKLKRLAKAVESMAEVKPKPMPKGSGFVSMTGNGDYVTELRRVTDTQVNGSPVPYHSVWSNGHHG